MLARQLPNEIIRKIILEATWGGNFDKVVAQFNDVVEAVNQEDFAGEYDDYITEDMFVKRFAWSLDEDGADAEGQAKEFLAPQYKNWGDERACCVGGGLRATRSPWQTNTLRAIDKEIEEVLDREIHLNSATGPVHLR